MTQLHPREREAARLLTHGLTNPEIARAMSISELTVETHLKNIRQKWGVQNRMEIAILALGNVASIEEAQEAIRRKHNV